MSDKDTYFLTESVSLKYLRLIQTGIRLDKDRKEFVYEGPYTAEKHLAWIEHRRRRCQQRGWLAKDIINVGGDMQILFGKELSFPPDLMELIWKLTDSPTGTPYSEIKINEKISGLIYREIQIPFISWLHENTLKSIISRREELLPNKNNPAIKSLWEFNQVAQNVIEGWYVHNGLDVPQIAAPGARGNLWLEFIDFVKGALACGQQTDVQLWEWKERFSEFPASYFRRYEKRTGKPLPSTSGLAWRRNPKFRKPRKKKSAQ